MLAISTFNSRSLGQKGTTYMSPKLKSKHTNRKDYNVEKIMQMSHFIGYMNTFSGLKTMRERNPTIAEDPLQTISRK